MEVDPREFRNTLGRFASGVTVITVQHGEEVRGVTANAFMSVSLDPPLVLVCINKRANSHATLMEAERYGVSILNDDQEELSNHFAGMATEGIEPLFTKLADFPVLEDALAHLVCRIVGRHEAGDHTLFIGQVERLRPFEGSPLLYFRGRYGHFKHPEQAPILDT